MVPLLPTSYRPSSTKYARKAGLRVPPYRLNAQLIQTDKHALIRPGAKSASTNGSAHSCDTEIARRGCGTNPSASCWNGGVCRETALLQCAQASADRQAEMGPGIHKKI